MKKTMKRVLAAAAAAILLLTLFTGCSPTGTSKKIKIGVAQSIEHTSLNQIKDAILEKLKALGYTEETADIDYQNAQGSPDTLNSICKKFQGDSKDLVIAVGTTTALAVCGSIQNIPIVFSSVTDPVGAGLVEAFDKTDRNITGVANFFPIEDIFSLARKLSPDVKNLGFIHCSSEFGAGAIIEDAKGILKDQYPEISFTETTISSASELKQAMESLVGKVDAIFVPNDSVIASAMSIVTEITREKKIPVYVTADSLVYDGGLATVGINYVKLGEQTAVMADAILKGQSVADTNVEYIDEFRTVINQTTADQIGVAIPEDLRSSAEIAE